jgi:hypothetical protein
MQKHTTPTKTRLARIAALVAVALATAGVFAATASASVSADYVDFGGDHFAEAVIRESPWLPQYNVGAKCYSVTASETLTVRPPAVWALQGYGTSRETVWWRAVFADTTGRIVHYGGWVSSSATRTQATEFGSGGDPTAFNAYDSSYYTGGESWSRSNYDGSLPLVPYVEVAWQQPSSVAYGWMRVQREVVQVGYSTQGPAYMGTC